MGSMTPDYYMNEMMDMMGLLMGGYFATMLLSLGFSLLLWILRSLGLYTAAHRRGIKNPWMAWVPVAELWILGSLSDQYYYVARGKVKNRRKWLIAAAVAQVLGILTMIVVMMMTMIKLGISLGQSQMDPSFQEVMAVVSPMLLVSLVTLAIQLWANILQWMCLYGYFASSDPGNKTVYTIIGILINVTMPFFIFICRNKDGGMPPRKGEAAPAPVIPAPVAAEPGEEEPVNKF